MKNNLLFQLGNFNCFSCFNLLGNYMSFKNRKTKTYICFGNVLNKLCIKKQKEKRKTLKTFSWTQNTYFHAEIWKISVENMEDKILSFQFEPVSTKPTCPSYTVEATKIKRSIINWLLESDVTVKTAKRFRPD